MSKEYRYGMRLRGFAPLTFPPFGFVRREDDPEGKYWDILVYDVELGDKVTREYDLDFLPSQEQRIEKVAVRLDALMKDLDPYNYRDNKESVDKAREILTNDPYTVIEDLMEWLEELI